jgi:protein arginine kinase
MERKSLLLRHSDWMQETPKAQVILSSRIRLARNIENTPFPQVLALEDSEELEKKIAAALLSIDVDGDKLEYFSLTDLTGIEQHVLIEKHLISPNLVAFRGSRGVALTQDHRISVMVNEEDHLRIQALLPGDRLKEAYHLANWCDDELEKLLDFAYREAQGYLTACPTNVGTGMRASVMIHIPALVMTRRVQHLLGALTHLGLAVRGLYGEGSDASGHLFQMSNQITLGKSEEDTITHLEAVTKQIVEHELQAREGLFRDARLVLEDKVWRARGTLQNARLLTSQEALESLSLDQLGVDMGILPQLKQSFGTLLVDTLPASLQYVLNQELEPGQRDEQRAQYIRQATSELEGKILEGKDNRNLKEN